MKRIILFLFSYMVSVTAWTQSIADNADTAYNEGRFEDAISLYKNAGSIEGTSEWLYYNLGNAYYRTDSIAKAILCYERALKINPSNEDARFNLQFLNDRYNLQKPTASATSAFISKLTNSMKPNSWAMAAVILFALTLAAAAVYILLSKPLYRKIGFFSCILLIPFTIAAIAIAFNAHSHATSRNRCVVITPSAQLSTVPSTPITASQQAFTVPEGYVLEIVDSISSSIEGSSTWFEVKVEDDNRAWVNSKDIEII